MTIIEITPLDNFAHRNQTTSDPIPIPEGWAVVPDEMLPLENFPYGDLALEDVDGVPTVTGWTPQPIPAPELGPLSEPSESEQLRADVDYIAAMTGVVL